MKSKLFCKILSAAIALMICIPMIALTTSAEGEPVPARDCNDNHRYVYFDNVDMSTGAGSFTTSKMGDPLTLGFTTNSRGAISPASAKYGVKVQATQNDLMGISFMWNNGYGIGWTHTFTIRYKMVNVTSPYKIQVGNLNYNPQNIAESAAITPTGGWQVYTCNFDQMTEISKTSATPNFMGVGQEMRVLFEGVFTEDSYVIIDYCGRADSTNAAAAEAEAQAPIWEPAERTPVFSIPGDTYTETKTVTITCSDAEAKVYYTTDGSEPSATNGTLYSEPIAVNATMTLKAVSVKEGKPDSPVCEATYTINPTVKTPAFSLAAGKYTGEQSVEITCETEGATIYYTTDGTAPTETSAVYSGAIKITETTILKAIAVKEGMTSSKTISANYNITKGSSTTAKTEVNTPAGDNGTTAGGATEEKGGCGSTVAFGTLSLVATLTLAGAAIAKKKED